LTDYFFYFSPKVDTNRTVQEEFEYSGSDEEGDEESEEEESEEDETEKGPVVEPSAKATPATRVAKLPQQGGPAGPPPKIGE